MLDKLKDLCLLDGISGDEGAVREYIIDKIGDKAEIKVDNLGNVIAFCKGKKTPKNKIMVSAHMDEVGMIVTYVNSDGTLKVSSVGGVDPRVVFGRRVKIGRNNVLGVVGGKAIHNLTAEERKKSVPFDKLTIDIGVDSREEALKLVRLGDSVRFVSDFVEYGEGFVKCKAIDDRAGCAIMLRMIEEGVEYDADLVMGNRKGGGQHFWGEIKIDGVTYLLEVGEKVYDSPQWNYKWQFMCLKYSEADGGYKKNGKLY